MFWLIKTAVKLALLAAVVSVPLAYARLLDIEGLKTALLEQVLGCAGRRLEIHGGVEIQAGYPPKLTVEGVRLGNAPWGRAEYMLTIDRLEAEFDLLPLAAGDIAAPRVRLMGVEAVFETNAAGEGNWEAFGVPADADRVQAAGLAAVLWPLAAAGAVTITDGSLTVIDGVGGAQMRIPLEGGGIKFAAADREGRGRGEDCPD